LRPSQRPSWRRSYTFHQTDLDDGHRANLVADDHRGRAGASDSQFPAGSSASNIDARQPVSVFRHIEGVTTKEDPMAVQIVMDHTRHQFDAADGRAVSEAEARFMVAQRLTCDQRSIFWGAITGRLSGHPNCLAYLGLHSSRCPTRPVILPSAASTCGLQGVGGFSQRSRDLLAMGSQNEPAAIGSHRAIDERDQHALFKPGQRA
jgi:hypothetical protein